MKIYLINSTLYAVAHNNMAQFVIFVYLLKFNYTIFKQTLSEFKHKF